MSVSKQVLQPVDGILERQRSKYLKGKEVLVWQVRACLLAGLRAHPGWVVATVSVVFYFR